MNGRRVVIRADGGTSIGMGHVVRCVALADMICSRFDIVFCIRRTSPHVHTFITQHGYGINIIEGATDTRAELQHFTGFIQPDDIVVLDGYDFRTEYQKAIKATGCKLVAIDDLHAWHHVADLIINHSGGISAADYSASGETQFLIGTRYALLRKEFLEIHVHRQQINHPSKFFISMGAADIQGNTLKFAHALTGEPDTSEVHIMLSELNPHVDNIRVLAARFPEMVTLHFNISATELIQLLKHNHLAICPASSISLEACAVGIILIAGYTATNQLGILKTLTEHESAFNFGDLDQLKEAEFVKRLTQICQDPESWNRQWNNQKRMIDGRSGERIREAFDNLAGR